MDDKKNLSMALQLIQFSVIGLFKASDNTIECVIDEDEHTFETIHIGLLLGLQTSTLSKSNYCFIKFPNDITLAKFINEPIKLSEWYEENFK